MTKIIGISGISGAGTTTITKALGERLEATMLFWDDFDEISQGPDDYVEWFTRSGDYANWHYPALEHVLRELKEGRSLEHPVTRERLIATELVILDSSMGRKHEATGRFVDFQIHLDTSMDVALARRLVRDYCDERAPKKNDIIAELEWYLQVGRPLFVATDIKETADLVVDGDSLVEDVVTIIASRLSLLSEPKKDG